MTGQVPPNDANNHGHHGAPRLVLTLLTAIMDEESLERALADVEMLTAAYPDEVSCDNGATDQLPWHVTLRLSETAHVQLSLGKGYPTSSNIEISSYRCGSDEKSRMEAVLVAIRSAAQECLTDGMEGGFACCAAALEAWNESGQDINTVVIEESAPVLQLQEEASGQTYRWTTGEPLLDRKSAFQAHVCRITAESDVRPALFQLLNGNSKLQRATHNMWAYRVVEHRATDADDRSIAVLKHDNDNDGEDAAGSRLAHLLEMRNEDQVLVVVSRWFGGIHLGPKRFAHITNVARELLVTCHEEWDSGSTSKH